MSRCYIRPMSKLPPLPKAATGRYRHYKGGEYEVIDVVRHSETLEPLVLYRALYGERGLRFARTRCSSRPSMWMGRELRDSCLLLDLGQQTDRSSIQPN